MLKAAVTVLGFIKSVVDYLHDRALTAQGRAQQQAADLQAAAKEQVTNAEITDANSALTRRQLIDKLRADGAGHQ